MGYSIQPVTIWVNGESKQANYIIAKSIYDDLSTMAKFYYNLTIHTETEEGSSDESLASGNIDISGQAYIDWDASPDINLAAYEYICAQLNLTLE